MEDTVLKLVFASIILMVGLAGILLPLYITDVSPRLLNLLNAATGGVLLAAGFVHLLPDANAVLMPRFPAFPWAPFLAATGFLSILFVEELANISIGAPSSAPDFRGGDGSHAVGGWRSVSQGDEAPAEPLQEPLELPHGQICTRVRLPPPRDFPPIRTQHCGFDDAAKDGRVLPGKCGRGRVARLDGPVLRDDGAWRHLLQLRARKLWRPNTLPELESC